MAVIHKNLTGDEAIHEIMYVQSSDPGAVGANKFWLDTTSGATLEAGGVLKQRNGADSGWTTRADIKTALDLKAALASPTFTGTPAAPTAAPGTNTTQVATTAFVTAAVAAQGGGDALTTDPLSQFAATTSAQLAGVISDETGSGALVFGTAPTLSGPLGIVENDIGASTHDAGNTSTAITIDWSLGRAQKCTATDNFTLTHSNMVAGLVYTLEVLTGAGSFTATFSSTNWAGGTAPTLTVTASKEDIFTFYKNIGGTIVGAVFGQSITP